MSDSLQIKNVISEESNQTGPLPPVFIPEGSKQTSLSTSWAFWCQKKNKKTKTTTTNWSEGTQCVGRFSTAEGFWHLYTHIVRADKIQGSVDVMLFRDGIRPVWEDEANKLGGKLSIKLKKGLSALLWEELILGMIGEQLADCDICGAVLSVRFHDDTIALWLRNADSEESVNAAKNAFKDILRLPPWCQAEFSRFSRRVGGGGGGGVEGVDGVDEHSALPTSSSSHHQQRFSGNGGPTGATWKQQQQQQQLQNLAPSTSSSSSERLTHQTSGQHQSSHFQQQNQHQRGGSGGLNTEKILILGGPGGQSTLTVGGISSASAAGLSLASARAGNATKPQEGYPVSTSQQQQQQQSSSFFTTSDSGLSSLPLSNMASLSLRPKTLAATSLQNSSSLPLTSTSGGGSNSTVTSSGAEDRSSSTNANSQPVSPQPAWGGAKLHSSNASLSPINSSSVTSVSTTVKPYQGSMVQIQGVGGIQQSIISQSVSPVVQTHSQPTHIQSQQQQSQSHQPQQQQQQQQQHIQQQQMQLNSGSVQREFPSQQFQHHQPQGGQFQRQPHYSHQAHRSGYQGQNQQQHSQSSSSSSSQKHNSDQALASAPAPTVDTDGDGWETVAKKR
jgi:translation initiation factor 4E